uniref:Uncharacterized protein n=1 Tax=Candidatus Kentrum sp. MB TaxID=2138164 RepID=A0A451B918_9GAMM|nr:MAG: hypothetical protein BECKMB1821G_GA0114241_103226 [Candidatus Kentron sp. MB]VFK29371.1 MAG: hypothetical protein BECKMB1821I_GA0114274_100950 [Candidatus Kentron sp. MB]VFK74765.1 MAG: hypothetical protein BECKMB1821H_GA0114242_100950 [Candidatus Kentron sp. MB]
MDIRLTEQERIRVLNGEDVFAIMQKVLLRENKIDRDKGHFRIIAHFRESDYLWSFINHCVQVIPPITSDVQRKHPYNLRWDGLWVMRGTPPMLQLEREPGAHQMPQALQTGDIPRTLPVWPLRRRRSPFDFMERWPVFDGPICIPRAQRPTSRDVDARRQKRKD